MFGVFKHHLVTIFWYASLNFPASVGSLSSHQSARPAQFFSLILVHKNGADCTSQRRTKLRICSVSESIIAETQTSAGIPIRPAFLPVNPKRPHEVCVSARKQSLAIAARNAS